MRTHFGSFVFDRENPPAARGRVAPATQTQSIRPPEPADRAATRGGFGYAFDAQAEDEPEAKDRPLSIEAHVFWNRRTLPLVQGDNVIGREESCELRVDVAGVSRRHARIQAAHGQFVLEDLGSKNGTYLRDTRLGSPAVLRDRDEFRLGQTPLVFRIHSASASTATER
jgi:FHA domain